MENFLDVLRFTLPFLIILAAVFIVAWYFLKLAQKRNDTELKKSGLDKTVMVRLQACERLTLFLERIHPVQLVFRVNKPGMDLNTYKNLLLNTIREEYEHNLAQQIYVGDSSWAMLVNAKEELIRTINEAFLDLQGGGDVNAFAKKIIDQWLSKDKDPIMAARELIKRDANLLF